MNVLHNITLFDQVTQPMEKIQIQLVRNATLKMQYANRTLLIDPVLCPKNSFMSFVEPDKNLNPTVDLPCDPKDVIENVDAVLVTHAHPDHFDPVAMEMLQKDLPVFIQPADKDAILGAGFTKVSTVEDKITYEGISIERTTGVHGPSELDSVLGVVSGFILRAENHPTVYVIGDCIWDKDIEEQLKKHNPDVIITNSGAAKFMGEHQILMGAEETMKVAETVPNATVVAVHMEALDHCTCTRDDMRTLAEDSQAKVLIPEDGETFTI